MLRQLDSADPLVQVRASLLALGFEIANLAVQGGQAVLLRIQLISVALEERLFLRAAFRFLKAWGF